MTMTIIVAALLVAYIVCAALLFRALREMQTSLGAILWRISDHIDELNARSEERYHNLYAVCCEHTEYAERQLQAEIVTQGLVARLAEDSGHPPDENAAEDEKTASEKLKEKRFSEGVSNILNYDMAQARKKGR